MDWFGRASIEFTHAPSSLQLVSKKDGHKVSLADVCRESTPSCQLNPLLFNGHMQTFWTAVGTAAPHVYYRRRVFQSDHAVFAGSFAVDFAVDARDREALESLESKAPAYKTADPTLPERTTYFTDEDFDHIGSDDDRPMLLVLHGLSGGSYESYLRQCIGPLIEDGRDWAVAVINSRGCANSALTSGILFNARTTWDMRHMVSWAQKTFPNRPLFGLGFSLGSNILTNYLGEEGADCPLSAAVVVSNPFDMQACNKALQRTIIGRNVYEVAMGQNLKRLALRHKEALSKSSYLDFDAIEKVQSVYEFDRVVQCPTWGYPTEEAYYRDASSSDAVLNVRIPYFVVHAKDDPIAVSEAVPYQEILCNPYAVLCMTSLGGHLSWYEMSGGRWHAKPVSNFLQKMATEIDLKSIPRVKDLDSVCLLRTADHKSFFNPLRRKWTPPGLDGKMVD